MDFKFKDKTMGSDTTSAVKKWAKFYKKLHRWPGLILSFVLLYYGITGVIMNHRELLSGGDVSRTFLPDEYNYKNWNNGALKGNLIITNDSILVYGNIGVWVTDSTFKTYRSFNTGLPKGTDNRKIYVLHRTLNGDLYAATLFGLYGFDHQTLKWEKFDLDVKIKRFVGVASTGDTVFAINRSYLFKGKSEGVHTRFKKIELQKPPGYVNDVGLFETIWQIHSGEIMGISGQLFVDFLGIITIFLSVTGIFYFFFPLSIKKRKIEHKSAKQLIQISKWSLKWHNKAGAWFFAFLIVLFFTGMFLRPPLLIPIAYSRVSPIKYSRLDQSNPWYDKLRAIYYDHNKELFLLSTSDGMYYFKDNSYKPNPFLVQPPVSVMGINVLERYDDQSYLIGSFSGLFLWDPSMAEIVNFPNGTVYQEQSGGRPIGDFKVTGIIHDTQKNLYMVDYDLGVVPLYQHNEFPAMPANLLSESKISLWSLSLEFHTGRMFHFLMGDFYILLVPLSGLFGVMVVLSGYLLWRKKYRVKSIQ